MPSFRPGQTATRLAASATLALLAACGSPATPAPQPEKTPAAADQPPADNPQERRASVPINAFAFKQTGTQMLAPVPEAQDMKLSGGCDGNSPLVLSMFHGAPIDGDWFSIGFMTQDPFGAEATGTIPLSQLTWDNGASRPENLPPDSPLKTANRYLGKGTLTLETHIATPEVRRMVGRVEGHVEQYGRGNSADITVDFDISFTCHVR